MNREKIEELRCSVQQFIRLFGLLDQSTTPCGFALSVSQVIAMQELEQQTLTVSELSQRLQLERSSVSRLIDNLVKAGFASRVVNEQNRREVLLSLTEKGKRSIGQVREQSIGFYQSILDQMQSKDQEIILQAFHILTKALHNLKGERHE